MALPEWLNPLALLPAEAEVRRRPVGSAELTVDVSPIAGWEALSVELSAGAAGGRHILVTLDGSGTPIAANDHVALREEGEGPARWRHESIGGRIEADGSFRGTCWTVFLAETDGEDAAVTEAVKREPSPAEADAILELAREILRRLNPGSARPISSAS